MLATAPFVCGKWACGAAVRVAAALCIPMLGSAAHTHRLCGVCGSLKW